MNHLCPKCNTTLNNPANPMLVRIHMTKEERPKPRFVTGYLDPNGVFTSVNPSHSLEGYSQQGDDVCLGCIDSKDKALHTNLFTDDDGERLPSYVLMLANSDYIKDLVKCHSIVLDHDIKGAIGKAPIEMLMTDSDPSELFTMAEYREEHEENIERLSLSVFELETHVVADGTAELKVFCLSPDAGRYATSQQFPIIKMLELAREDRVYVE